MALSSWEETFHKEFVVSVGARKAIDLWGIKYVEELKNFIRQTIKTERAEAVKEAYQSPEFTDVIELEVKKAREQAVREYKAILIEKIKKELPKEKDTHGIIEPIKVGDSRVAGIINYGFNDCLKKVKDILAKY